MANIVDVSTDDNLQYTFYPVSNGIVNFKVRTPNDAHIALTAGPGDSQPIYEIMIGGWGNTKSVIRKNKQQPERAQVDTPGIVNGDEFRGFWVRFGTGSISAGIEGQPNPFIYYDDPEPFHVSFVGVCTGWGASGSWKIEGGNEFRTEDKLEYIFHPIISGELTLEFRGPSNCHIALTMENKETDPMYEIMIGGWENTKSVIRHRRQQPDKVTANTPGIVHPGEYRKFLIQWRAGRVIVRSGSGAVIMEWTDEKPFRITHFGVRTGWGARGQWRIPVAKGTRHGGVPSAQYAPPSHHAPSAPLIYGGGGGGAQGQGCWVDARQGVVPPGAVVGGQDGEQLFVGRAKHEGALIPGKVVQSHGVCYVAWGGGEHGKDQYQVLCGCAANWIPTSGANIPSGALPGGESEDGEPLFVGRVHHEGTLTVGKVQPSHGVCYIAYGGQELGFQDYEVLVA